MWFNIEERPSSGSSEQRYQVIERGARKFWDQVADQIPSTIATGGFWAAGLTDNRHQYERDREKIRRRLRLAGRALIFRENYSYVLKYLILSIQSALHPPLASNAGAIGANRNMS